MPSRRSFLAAGVTALAGSVAAACASSAQPVSPGAGHTGTPTPSPSATRAASPPDPASVEANELGFVPILMHHRLTKKVESEFDMTPDYFRAELERLRREGYYPVTTLALARRELDNVPAGKTPVVLTFDDASSSQFGYTNDGDIDPDTAVGMMLDFTDEHPDFPATASLYVNEHPFGLSDPAQAPGDLNDLGFEIGNHTFDHANLSTLTARGVQAEIGKLQKLVEAAVPGLTPHTLALPLGVNPDHAALARTGVYRGERYRNLGVLLVGASPSHSPYHKDFDPGALPRIRSSSYHHGRGEYVAKYWLDYLADHPDQRYRAAGNPGHVTFPRTFAVSLDPRFRRQAIRY